MAAPVAALRRQGSVQPIHARLSTVSMNTAPDSRGETGEPYHLLAKKRGEDDYVTE